MVSLTPELAGNSLVVMGIIYLVMIVFYIYSLYLNYKQAKVNNQMQMVLSELQYQSSILKEIRDKR